MTEIPMCPADCPIGGVMRHGEPLRACENRFDQGCVHAIQDLSEVGDLGIPLDLRKRTSLYESAPVQLGLFPAPRQGRLFPTS